MQDYITKSGDNAGRQESLDPQVMIDPCIIVTGERIQADPIGLTIHPWISSVADEAFIEHTLNNRMHSMRPSSITCEISKEHPLVELGSSQLGPISSL